MNDPISTPLRHRGTLKWFNREKGYGFITPDSRDGYTPDIFVHISAVEKADIDPAALWDGARIEFSEGQSKRGPGKPCAVDLKMVD